MSRYVLLIQTPLTYGTPPDAAITIESPVQYHAITTSNDPPVGLSLLQNWYPVKLTLLHTIPAANRADLLLQTLQIKFKRERIHAHWYILNAEQIAFIQSITADNVTNMIGLIHKQERNPGLTLQEAETLQAELLARAQSALVS